MNLYQTIRQDFSIRIGDTFGPFVLNLTKDSFDWSIASLKLKLFSTSCANFSILQELALTVVEESSVQAILELSAETTRGFEKQHYLYEIELTYSNVVRTIIAGKLKANDKLTSSYANSLNVNFLDSASMEVEFVESGIGKSNYQLWLDKGNTGTLEDYLYTLTQQLDPAVEERIKKNEEDLASFISLFNTGQTISLNEAQQDYLNA